MELAQSVSTSIFRYWGQNIVQVPAVDAAAATVTATVTALDDDGHLLEAGTQAQMTADDGSLVGFAVADDVTIAPGDTTTGTGEVEFVATEAGEASSGLSGAMTFIDSIPWADTITLTGATSGGVDAEEDADYLDRLVGELQLLSAAPILPVDFEILALRIPGISRAVAFDNYNPDDGSTNNERMIAVALAGTDGLAVSTDIKDAYRALIEGLREATFVLKLLDPTPNDVDVAYGAVAYPGFDPDTVETAGDAALVAYLDPTTWGMPPFGDPSTGGGWVNEDKVRIGELYTVLNQVEGLNYVTSLTINGGTVDVTLTGKAPVANASDVTGSVVSS